jgi:SAM-dependent methyltransferase
MVSPHALLAWPVVYRTFQRFVSGKGRETYVHEYVRPCPGESVLDIGCGPGDMLDYLPGVRYVGIDLSSEYVAAARGRYGTRGEFRCEDVGELVVHEPASFDLVMANGLLHHLDDIRASQLMHVARQALRPGGRLVTFDGCWTHCQSRFARFFLRRDRGRFVRDQAGYEKIAQESFPDIRSHIRYDLIRLPYTHLIMICRVPHSLGQQA